MLCNLVQLPQISMSNPPFARQAFIQGAIAILPLSLAVAPWGLLAGSMAIEANLSP
ncbi:hypothetical protein D3C84_1300810 [compost metagenome]